MTLARPEASSLHGGKAVSVPRESDTFPYKLFLANIAHKSWLLRLFFLTTCKTTSYSY